ncbi:Hypothetical predicted protein [Paramuricea clavata]|uniref:Uncharacterized protein n=1 Tax=Paramuricea clavata TaxID=317549 RepID=A0A6S7HNW4_PARCT|nr:Hypothetical predicted protein [Paramuricea clavata]
MTSKGKYYALDETAVCGLGCKHGIPMDFLNLKGGERLAYGVYLLTCLTAKTGNGVTIHFMYDICCLLETHLKKQKNTELLNCIKLACPQFHVYGHGATCQENVAFMWLRMQSVTGILLSILVPVTKEMVTEWKQREKEYLRKSRPDEDEQAQAKRLSRSITKESDAIPVTVKRAAIDACAIVERCSEEQEIVLQEMTCVNEFHSSCTKKERYLEELGNNESFANSYLMKGKIFLGEKRA